MDTMQKLKKETLTQNMERQENISVDSSYVQPETLSEQSHVDPLQNLDAVNTEINIEVPVGEREEVLHSDRVRATVVNNNDIETLNTIRVSGRFKEYRNPVPEATNGMDEEYLKKYSLYVQRKKYPRDEIKGDMKTKGPTIRLEEQNNPTARDLRKKITKLFDGEAASPEYQRVLDSASRIDMLLVKDQNNIVYDRYLSEFYKAVKDYYESNSGVKWSRKGRRRRENTKELLEFLDKKTNIGSSYRISERLDRIEKLPLKDINLNEQSRQFVKKDTRNDLKDGVLPNLIVESFLKGGEGDIGAIDNLSDKTLALAATGNTYKNSSDANITRNSSSYRDIVKKKALHGEGAVIRTLNPNLYTVHDYGSGSLGEEEKRRQEWNDRFVGSFLHDGEEYFNIRVSCLKQQWMRLFQWYDEAQKKNGNMNNGQENKPIQLSGEELFNLTDYRDTYELTNMLYSIGHIKNDFSEEYRAVLNELKNEDICKNYPEIEKVFSELAELFARINIDMADKYKVQVFNGSISF